MLTEAAQSAVNIGRTPDFPVRVPADTQVLERLARCMAARRPVSLRSGAALPVLRGGWQSCQAGVAVLREAGAIQLLAASPAAPHVGSGRLDKRACLLLSLGNQVILTAVGTGVTTDGLATQPVKQAAYR